MLQAVWRISLLVRGKRFSVSTARSSPGVHRGRLLLAVAGLTVFLSAAASYAQVSGGALQGLVTDPSGAPVPGAEIQATHIPTNTPYTTVATADGTYTIGGLRIGPYRVVVKAKGFKQSITEVSVLTATTTPLNIKLELGSATQQVTVVATTAPILQTSNAEQATVIERKTLLDLPSELGGSASVVASGRRQIDGFLFLTPGVTGTQFSKHTNGAPSLASEVLIDGLPFTQPETPGFIAQSSPPFESVQEFKASNSIPPAEYGRGFGVEIFTLKSGTNQWHGDAYEFLRNEVFDARGFFAARRPKVRQNNFGGTLGGPIIKNKLFIFGAFDQINVAPAAFQTSLVTLPTMAMRSGDFSQLVDSAGKQIQIYNPASTRPDGQGGFTRDQFPGNKIPIGDISAVAGRVMGLLPQPDFNTFPNNFVSRARNTTVIDRVPEFKADYTLNEKQHLSGHFWRTVNPISNVLEQLGTTSPLDSGFPGAPGWLGGYGVNWDWVFSPHLLNHFGFGNETLIGGRGIDTRKGNQVLKIPGIDPNIGGYPAFYISGLPELGNSDQTGNERVARLFVWTDAVTWTHGRHVLKFGGQIWKQHQYETDSFSAGSVAGTFRFDNLETSLPDSPNFGSWGSPIASFLVGAVDSAQRKVKPQGDKRDWHLPYYALYGEDTIQATRKLTLSLGLRYDLPFPFRDTLGGMSALDLNLPNPGAGNLPGAYVFGNSKVLPPIDTHEFGPRIGVAYQLNDRTVIRTGYAINYAQSNGAGLGSRQFGNAFYAGYSPSQSFVSPNDGVTPASQLDAGFPAYTGPVPNFDPAIQNGGLADAFNSDGDRQAEEQSWTFDIQREIPGNILVDAAYVGNRGEHLPANLENLNQVPSHYLSLGPILTENINSPDAVKAGIKPPFPGFSGTVAQALRPFPQFTGIQNSIQPVGNSFYHSLQVKVQKRFSDGLAFLVSYTLSKTVTDTGGGNGFAAFDSAPLDTYHRQLQMSLGGNDVTHDLVANWVYQLPFGRGLHGPAHALANGWEINGIFTATSGSPIGIGGGSPLPLFGGGNKPNRVLGAPEKAYSGSFDPAKDRYVNINAFKLSPPFTFGNVSPTEPSLRTFPYYDTDLAIIKRTRVPYIGEAGNLEFRVEMFNAFNWVVFGGPSTSVSNPASFGRVSSQANAARVIQFGLKLNF